MWCVCVLVDPAPALRSSDWGCIASSAYVAIAAATTTIATTTKKLDASFFVMTLRKWLNTRINRLVSVGRGYNCRPTGGLAHSTISLSPPPPAILLFAHRERMYVYMYHTNVMLKKTNRSGKMSSGATRAS